MINDITLFLNKQFGDFESEDRIYILKSNQ